MVFSTQQGLFFRGQSQQAPLPLDYRLNGLDPGLRTGPRKYSIRPSSQIPFTPDRRLLYKSAVFVLVDLLKCPSVSTLFFSFYS